MKTMTILLSFMLSSIAMGENLPNNLDILCVPSGGFDGGFSVIGQVQSQNSFEIMITTASGWGDSKKLFHGSMILSAKRDKDNCQISLVDQVKTPKSVIEINKGQASILKKLNGKVLTKTVQGKPVDLDNSLSCRFSEKGETALISFCK